MTPETTPEPVPAPTVIPETGEEAVSGEISAEAAAPEKREETAEEQSPSFLQRVWDFLLRITPWALGAAVIVLFLVTYAIRAKQRKGK